MLKEINVSTAAIIDGWRIEEYCGFVTSQVVAGTGFFSDFAASFSDFFGGRSGTYQRQLASLRSEALQRLREQALRLGANWIIGVRMDFDEISGKGKQMFMVTVQGTAVIAHPGSTDTSEPAERLVPSDDLRVEVARRQIVERAQRGDMPFDEDMWASITEHCVDEAVPLVIAEVHRVKQATFDQTDVKNRALSFFRTLQLDALQRHLHQTIIDSPSLAPISEDFITTMGVVDLQWVLAHLQNPDTRIRRSALQLLRGYAPFYSSSDLQTIEAIILALETSFPGSVEVVERKGLLSRKPEMRWLCECGTDNRLEHIKCQTCARDKKGLLSTDLHPEEAVKALRDWLDILRGMPP